MSTSLYELAGQYRVADEAETTEEAIEAIEAVYGDITIKAQNICKLLRSLEGEAMAFASEITRLQERRQAIENKAAGLKEYMRTGMLMAGIEKLKAGTFSLALQKSPLSCAVLDQAAIPEEYRRIVVETKIDRKAILDDVKQGVVVPGVEITQGVHLRIR